MLEIISFASRLSKRSYVCQNISACLKLNRSRLGIFYCYITKIIMLLVIIFCLIGYGTIPSYVHALQIDHTMSRRLNNRLTPSGVIRGHDWSIAGSAEGAGEKLPGYSVFLVKVRYPPASRQKDHVTTNKLAHRV